MADDSNGHSYLIEEEPIQEFNPDDGETIGDEFGHDAHVRTLEQVISFGPANWNIGLFGPWGSGKSSIINELYSRLRDSHWASRDSPDDSVSLPMGVTEEKRDEYRGLGDNEELACVSINAWGFDKESPRSDLVLEFNRALLEEAVSRFGETAVANYLTIKHSNTDFEETCDGSTLADVAGDIDQEERFTTEDLSESGILNEEEIITTLYDTKKVQNEDSISLSKAFKRVDPVVLLALGLILGLPATFAILSQTNPAIVGNIGLDFSLIYGAVLGIAGSATLMSKPIVNTFVNQFFDARTETTQFRENPRHEWPGIYRDLFNQIIDEAGEMWKLLGEKSAAQALTDGGTTADVGVENGASPDQSKGLEGVSLDRVVITIDDLDRCESSTAYQLLVAMKSFLDHPDCVYIVPCDEDALYHHLEGVNPSDYLGDARNQQSFLSKFFDTEVEIPEPGTKEIREYFDKMAERVEPNFDTQTERVLLAADLKTPRRVLQAINRYTVMLELADHRDLSTNSDSSGRGPDPFLAKLSVLREDYPNFHAAIEDDPDLLDRINKSWGRGISDDDGERLLAEVGVPEERRQALITFLSRTGRADPDSEERLAEYLRLSSAEQPTQEIFERRFKRGETDAVIEMYRSELQKSLEATDSKNPVSEIVDRLLDPDTDSIDQFQQVVWYQLEAGSTRDVAIERTAEILVKCLEMEERSTDEETPDTTRFWKTIRTQLAELLVRILDETDTEDVFAHVSFDNLQALITATDQKGTVIDAYVDALVGEDGLRQTNLDSLVDGIDTTDDSAIREALTQELKGGYQEGHLSAQRYRYAINRLHANQPKYVSMELLSYEESIV